MGQTLSILLCSCSASGCLTASSYFKRKSSELQREENSSILRQTCWARDTSGTVTCMPCDPGSKSRFGLSRPWIPQLFGEQNTQNYRSCPLKIWQRWARPYILEVPKLMSKSYASFEHNRSTPYFIQFTQQTSKVKGLGPGQHPGPTSQFMRFPKHSLS